MRSEARVQTVIEMMDLVVKEDRPADGVISYYYKHHRYIGSKDRQAINTRLYRLMRIYHKISWWVVQRAGRELTGRNMVIAEMLLSKEQGADTLHRIFCGTPTDHYPPKPLTRSETAYAELLNKQDLEHEDMSEEVRLECPEWAYKQLKDTLGDGFEAEMKAMMGQAPLDLRVNTLLSDRNTVFSQLKKDEIDLRKCKMSWLGLRVKGRPPLSQHDLYRTGHFEIQDEGSQMVAFVADTKPGEQVVDFCAGAGGKTLAMAASMENKGRIIATDVLETRLNRSKHRFRRANAFNIETRPLSSEHDKWVKRHTKSFDCVLVDAPCSGTGTWRRDPDKRFKQLGPGLVELLPLQKSILQSASRLVKPGGRLVYATCSLLNSENENQIKDFLFNNPDFTVKPVSEINEAIPADGDYLNLTVAKDDTDGFFAACLVRSVTDADILHAEKKAIKDKEKMLAKKEKLAEEKRLAEENAKAKADPDNVAEESVTVEETIVVEETVIAEENIATDADTSADAEEKAIKVDVEETDK